MSRVYLKVPGAFVFIEDIRKGQDPIKERQRIEALALKAINKYFTFSSTEENNAYNYALEKK